MILNLFQLPKFDDEERWFNRMIYNLMYYQSNYLMSAIVIFMLVFTWRPQEMMAGIIIMVNIEPLNYISFFFKLSMISVIFSRSLRLDSCQHWLEEEPP